MMGVRELETGAAGDVGGVLRVGRGGGWYDWDDGEGDKEGGWGGEGGGGEAGGQGRGHWEEVREMEVLYLVRRDGSARVFERGANGL